MALSGKVKEYLDRQGLAYGLIARAAEGTLPQIAEVAGIMPRRLLRVVLLRDVEAVVMAILPSDRILDFSLLCQILGRDLEPLYGDEIVPFFTDCELGTRPPLPELFGMQALVDESLLDPNELYFDSGSCAALVRMTSKDFQVLMGNARWGRFSHGIEVLQLLHGQATLSEHISDAADRYTPKRLKKGIEAIKELPALPATAQHILALRDNPAGRVEALNQIVERDPSLGRPGYPLGPLAVLQPAGPGQDLFRAVRHRPRARFRYHHEPGARGRHGQHLPDFPGRSIGPDCLMAAQHLLCCPGQ